MERTSCKTDFQSWKGMIFAPFFAILYPVNDLQQNDNQKG